MLFRGTAEECGQGFFGSGIVQREELSDLGGMREATEYSNVLVLMTRMQPVRARK